MRSICSLFLLTIASGCSGTASPPSSNITKDEIIAIVQKQISILDLLEDDKLRADTLPTNLDTIDTESARFFLEEILRAAKDDLLDAASRQIAESDTPSSNSGSKQGNTTNIQSAEAFAKMFEAALKMEVLLGSPHRRAIAELIYPGISKSPFVKTFLDMRNKKVEPNEVGGNGNPK